jgi:hypothetical protein
MGQAEHDGLFGLIGTMQLGSLGVKALSHHGHILVSMAAHRAKRKRGAFKSGCNVGSSGAMRREALEAGRGGDRGCGSLP